MVYCNKTLYVRNVRSKESEKSNLCQKLYVDVSLETPEQCTASVLRKSSLRGAGNMSKALLTYCNILWFPGSSAEV